jgi:7-cyano-7-deazaguanine synthase
MTTTKAIILLSGGLDSATVLGMALDAGKACYPVAFDYGQRHKRELDAAARVAAHYRNDGHDVNDLRVVALSGLDLPSSALTSDIGVPTGTPEGEIPVTYVPARNSMFLAIGTAIAEAIGADEVHTGFNAVDYSGYPDCREEYARAMERALALGTKRGIEGNPVRVVTPIIRWSKEDIVRKALRIGVPLRHTWSCYAGLAEQCGVCDSCVIRSRAFAAAGVGDPASA